MLAVLRRPNYTLLWLGGLVSVGGDWMLLTALPFYVYAQTGSALATSGMFFAFFLPYLLFGSVAGVFVDRWDRRLTMIVCDLARAALMLCLLAVRSPHLIWIVFVVAFLEQSIGTLFAPARGALIPHVVDDDQLVAANSLRAASDNLARIVAPPVGGVLLGAAGLSSVIVVDSASYLFSALMIFSLRLPATATEPVIEASGPVMGAWKTVWSDWRAGLSLVRKSRILTGLFLVLAGAALADSMLTGLLVPFSRDVLVITSAQFGWLMTARGVGGLAGAFVVGWVGKHLTSGRLLSLSLGMVAVCLALLFNVHNYVVDALVIGLAGIPAAGWMISEQTMVQQHTVDEFRGRVFASLNTVLALMGLGGLSLSGSMGSTVGILPVLNSSAVLTLLSALLALAFFWPVDRDGRARERGTPDTAVAALEKGA